ncbi:ankyrin repeat domain-containing protein [Micrococcoides hystricis]|uniref:Ankyrin repeat domain-containing protein n=1 Tax=Micrococcoides hystricis TaxID=1572761 RepID=A0ABV6P9I6_9MICC
MTHTPDQEPTQSDSDQPAELSPQAREFLERAFDMTRGGDEAKLLMLLQQGLPANLTNENGDSFLILAAYNDHTSLAQTLLNKQADVNWANQRGQTALTCAVFKQNIPLIQLLLNAGADPDAGEQSATQVAQMFGTEEIQNLLAQKK